MIICVVSAQTSGLKLHSLLATIFEVSVLSTVEQMASDQALSSHPFSAILAMILCRSSSAHWLCTIDSALSA
jgi:hypothetical protein